MQTVYHLQSCSFSTSNTKKKILFCLTALHSLLSFICEFERCRMGCQYVTQTTHVVCTISQLIDGSWERPTVPIYVDSKARSRGEVTHAHHCLAHSQALREAQTQNTEHSSASLYNLQPIQIQTQNDKTQTQIESRHNWWRTYACQFIEQPRCDHNNSDQPTAARFASKFYQAKKIWH